MSDNEKRDEQNKLDKKPEKKVGDLSSDTIKTPLGSEIYDKGESVVEKMNRERAIFDKDQFFQELFQDYLISVQRNDDRKKPSGIILKWDMHTTFDDFVSDALDNIDRQLESIRFAKITNAHKISSTDGNFFLSEAKIDDGSKEVTKDFNVEDYDAINELLYRCKEAIMEYKSGKLQLIVNEKTGRTRVASAIGD